MSDTKNVTASTADIDKAINAAKERAAAKKAGTAGASAASTEPAKPRLTEAERAAAKEKIEQERNERKAAKEQERKDAAEARAAAAAPAHMKKVEAAAAKLRPMSDRAQLLFNEATTNLEGPDLANFADHVIHFCRAQSTKLALDAGGELVVGQTVKVRGGDYPHILGATGTVVKVSRIRCYVNVPGEKNRPVPGGGDGFYFYCSDVEAVAAEAELPPVLEMSDAAPAAEPVDAAPAEEVEPIAAAG